MPRRKDKTIDYSDGWHEPIKEYKHFILYLYHTELYDEFGNEIGNYRECFYKGEKPMRVNDRSKM